MSSFPNISNEIMVLVVGVVFLLLFRLPTAANLHDKPPFYWLWEKKEKDPNEGKWKACCYNDENWGMAMCGGITCFVCLPFIFG